MKAAAVIEIDRDAMREERGKPDDYRGATPERIRRAEGHIAVGSDKRGPSKNTFLDSALDRVYARLVKAAKTENQIERLRVEYAALNKYHRLFVESGMVGSVGSVDFNRTYSPSPFGRTFLATTERQLDNREQYRRAQIHLGHKPAIVVDNVVCNGNSLEVAGFSIGKGSQRRAIAAAETMLRDAGFRLAAHWRMA